MIADRLHLDSSYENLSQPEKSYVNPIFLEVPRDDIPSLRGRGFSVLNPLNLDINNHTTTPYFIPDESGVILMLDNSREGRDSYLNFLTSRDKPILDNETLLRIRATSVGFVGCGTVGGNTIENIVRMGVGSIDLYDQDSYDLTNLNRQRTDITGLGRNKAADLALRMVKINPYLKTNVNPRRMRYVDVGDFVRQNDVLFITCDDPGIFRAVNKIAHDQDFRKPVIYPLDLAYDGVVVTFDYRDQSVPLYNGYFRDDQLEGVDATTIDLMCCAQRSHRFRIKNSTVQYIEGVMRIPAPLAKIADKEYDNLCYAPQTAIAASLIASMQARVFAGLMQGKEVRPFARMSADKDVMSPMENRQQGRQKIRKAPIRAFRFSRRGNK